VCVPGEPGRDHASCRLLLVLSCDHTRASGHKESPHFASTSGLPAEVMGKGSSRCRDQSRPNLPDENMVSPLKRRAPNAMGRIPSVLPSATQLNPYSCRSIATLSITDHTSAILSPTRR
jgi:hypothetical protein